MRIATDETDVLSRVVGWAAARDDVRLVLLTGSRANPGAPRDVLSDYDVALVVADPAPFAADDGWLRAVGRPLLRVADAESAFGMTVHHCMALYDDGAKTDWSIWPAAVAERVAATGTLPADFDPGWRVLLDKDGLARGWPAPTHSSYLPGIPTERAYQGLVQEVWFVATCVAKYLWRDEFLPAKVILDHELKYLLPRRLLDWRVGIASGWSVAPGFFGRGLRRSLDADLWADLERTYVGPDRAQNWLALSRTLDLFRRVAVAVGRDLGCAYPHDLDARMTDYIRQIRDLPPAGERS